MLCMEMQLGTVAKQLGRLSQQCEFQSFVITSSREPAHSLLYSVPPKP